FILSKDVLMRVSVLKLENAEYEFTWSFHHILMDGWCLGILNTEFFEIYAGYLENRPYHLPVVNPYRTYILWLEKQDKEESAHYWENYLASCEEHSRVPVPGTRKPKEEYFYDQKETVSLDLDIEKTRRLNELAAANHVTMNTLVQALWGILLGKYNSKEDVVFGTVVSGRPSELPGIESMIGLFINTIPVRVCFAGKLKFNELLEQIQQEALAGEPYHYHPLAEIQSHTSLKQDLIDHILVFENYPIAEQIEGYGEKKSAKTLHLTNVNIFAQNNYDLNVIISGSAQLKINLTYNRNVYDQDFAAQIGKHIILCIEQVIGNRELEIRDIALVSEEDKNRILNEFNDTAADYPKDKTIQWLFEEQVEQTPDYIAIVGPTLPGRHQVTYGELHQRSGQIANLLRAKGIKHGAIVGIMIEPVAAMVEGIMGILKAGCAFLPMEPESPVDRIDYVLNDSHMSLLLTQAHLTFAFKTGIEILNIEECIISTGESHNIITEAKPGDPIYVIYTSGTTGRPKGVLIAHKNMLNYVYWFVPTTRLTDFDRAILTSSFAFDALYTQFFSSLLTGCQLHMIPRETFLFAERLLDYLRKNKITYIKVTPSLFNLIANSPACTPEVLKGLRFVMMGGEEINVNDVEKVHALCPHLRMMNHYGPTETTIGSIARFLDFNKFEAYKNAPTIGKPLHNTWIYILDKAFKIIPIGLAGGLYIGGDGVGMGYINKPELTSEKFRPLMRLMKNKINKSFSGVQGPAARGAYKELFQKSPLFFYQTGDLARWHEDGNIEFLGRADDQVKIRGHRIELGEIERQLSVYPGVKEVVLLVREAESGKYICAYITSETEISFPGLRKYLSSQLPAYMIPAYFVNLEKIPLTVHGKVDRKALPDPREISLKDDLEYLPPQNAIEKKLVEIWEEVLGRTHIGINENFFQAGGDSIKSIQIISRMNSAGYKLVMKDLFQYPIIADLAPRVKKLQRKPAQTVITGTIPLTPIQEMFFARSYNDPHHNNHAVMFYSKERIAKEEINAVFRKIQEHHDALRMTYEINPGNGKIIQIAHGLDYPFSFAEYELNEQTGCLENIVERIQASIDLEKGPLMKLGLFHLEDGDRLLIVIHHLVIDGVSWRILFEDIETLSRQYRQNKRAGKLVLPSKTDSCKHWSEKLSVYANSKVFLKEKSYWQKLGAEAVKVPLIPKDFAAADNYNKDSQSRSFSLTEEETERLLTKVNAIFKTEINDILLTALAMGIKKTFGQDRLLVALEGHGREEILEEIDISRTVGWFTSIYPVVMDISYSGHPARQIKEIKETLRRVPNKGIGFGILKYLTGEEYKKEIEFNADPQISFNYLGQFDADVKQISFYKIAPESVGNLQSPNNKREYLLNVLGILTDKRLKITILFNKTHFQTETISTLVNNLEIGLKYIIEFCCSREKIERTPGDFTYKGLSIESVDRLMELYPNVEDIYTLTPMQEGMLYHAMVDNSSYAYFQQVSYFIRGELNISVVEKSLNELIKRHDILRTIFVYKDIERPVQVVLKDKVVDFYYEDISKLAGREEQENFIKEFKRRDKDRSFDLSKGPLMRVSIFRRDVSEYEFSWSHHHILMDGWCIGILNTEFFEIYTSYLENRPYRLPGVKPYRMYIQWLEKQDRDESIHYWENYLACFEEHSGILVPRTRKLKEENYYQNETVSLGLDIEKTRQLNKLAAAHHVTVNTWVQALWGILLGKYNGKEDVVFGAVVSGRPSELPGVESMIGLFINTIPVRVCFAGKLKFNELLGRIQQEALAGEPYHYHPLAEIQSRTSLKQDLIDHILVFENYPIAEQIEGYGSYNEGKKNSVNTLQLANVNTFEQTNYDFNVIISGSAQLKISLAYNGNVYNQDFAAQIGRHFIFCFDQVIENRELEIRDIAFVSEEDKNRILNEFNDTAADYPQDKTIHQLFEEQASKRPDRTALVEHVGLVRPVRLVQLTYLQLNEQSDRLAGLFIGKGVRVGSIVGIMMERSVEMIVGIMGILKSGGVYLPIDPGYPQKRIDYMLKDSGAKLLAVANDQEGEKVGRWEGEKVLLNVCTRRGFHHSSFIIHHSSCPAYIIYTSGTTGKPKGVLVMHRNVVRLVKNSHFVTLTEETRILQTGAPVFDATTFEIWGSLLNGGQLVLVHKELILNALRLAEILKDYCINTLWLSAPLFNQLTEENIKLFAPLGYLLVGGDRLSPGHINRVKSRFPHLKIINGYGPTENTTFSTTYLIEKEFAQNIPIGKPISNSTAYIIDKNDRLQPVGICGELRVGGDGVALGYINNPELTAERFDKYRSYGTHTTDINYKTGDLARWLPDGNIEFLGRIDNQVKIRGYRIELGEI
ncbi:MAG TPA: amino acid adenylation domain-containing protein, partial [Candidatus Kapabacteria bacterium]|nr:amino acid adenylation domain-containing protein [Candidatus Kapabacteria bacterium]